MMCTKNHQFNSFADVRSQLNFHLTRITCLFYAFKSIESCLAYCMIDRVPNMKTLWFTGRSKVVAYLFGTSGFRVGLLGLFSGVLNEASLGGDGSPMTLLDDTSSPLLWDPGLRCGR